MTQRRFSRSSLGSLRAVLPAMAVVVLFPMGASATDPDPATEVTFAKDVAPILQQNCQVCHQPGAIGPMSLLTYEEVKPWAEIIKIRVQQREMPPYHYDTDVGIQELQEDKRLSDEDIATITAWVDAGSPFGNAADLPAPVQWPDASAWRLADRFGQPDVVVSSEPHTVPAFGQDRWWQPVVPTGITEERCIRAIETKPSIAGRGVTHHANSSFRVEGPDGSAGTAGGRLSEYALGKLGEIIPEDACRVAPANSSVSWDIHYYPNGEDVVNDQVQVGIWFYPADFKKDSLYPQTLSLYDLEGGDFDIPPHGTLMTQGFHTFDHPVRIDSFQPHGHLRLVGMRLEILDTATGRKTLVSQISNWNPGWHLSHVYESDVAPLVPAGHALIITGWYDNTAENPHNPDADQWVGVGDRSTDEMSHAWIAVTHLDDAGFERLTAEREAKAAAAEKAEETAQQQASN